MEVYKGEEKRKSPRLAASLRSEVTLFDSTNWQTLERPCQTLTRNVSAGGLALTLDSLPENIVAGLRSGAVKMYVDINFPVMSDPIRVQAQAAWIKEKDESGYASPGIVLGLSFIDIPEWGRSKIDRYVNNALAREQ